MSALPSLPRGLSASKANCVRRFDPHDFSYGLKKTKIKEHTKAGSSLRDSGVSCEAAASPQPGWARADAARPSDRTGQNQCPEII